MRGGKCVVLFDSFFVVGLGIDAALPDSLRDVRYTDSAAGKRKRIVYEYGVAALGHFIGPPDAAVIALLVANDNRPGLTVDAGNFAPAEKFVSAVIVKRQDAWQASGRACRFEKDSFGARTTGKLPREAFDVQAVIFLH